MFGNLPFKNKKLTKKCYLKTIIFPISFDGTKTTHFTFKEVSEMSMNIHLTVTAIIASCVHNVAI